MTDHQFDTLWGKVAKDHVSLHIAKLALVDTIVAIQHHYQQYNGMYDDDKGWKLATCRSDIAFGGGDVTPGMLFLAKPIVRNGEVAIEVAHIQESVITTGELVVHHSIVTVDGGNVPGQYMSYIYFLEK